jgi:hypothetical protein
MAAAATITTADAIRTPRSAKPPLPAPALFGEALMARGSS